MPAISGVVRRWRGHSGLGCPLHGVQVLEPLRAARVPASPSGSGSDQGQKSWVGSSSAVSVWANRRFVHRAVVGELATTNQLVLPCHQYDPSIFGSQSLDGSPTGSSFASPAVLSAQIQAMEYEGYFSPLGTPLGNKAAIMASTVDANNDGPIGLTWRWSNQPADAKDGAGQFDFSKLKQILDNNWYYLFNLTDASFTSCGTGCREYIVGSITMSSTVRFAMAWHACSTARTTDAFINNDLDLRVQRNTVCGGAYESNSTSSEVEMLQLSSPSSICTASIRIRIKGGGTLNSCAGNGTETVALAWAYQ